jgi:Mrp family chromosome partitioning ATPase
MSQLIQGLRAKYDHVLIDTPPVLQLADAGILGSQSEEVLVVARMRRTPRPLVEQAITTLTSYKAQVSGIIATDNPRSRGRGYGYKYGYRYGYSYGYTSSRRQKKLRQREAA